MVEADSKSVVCEVRGELVQVTAITLRGSVPFLAHAPNAVIDMSGLTFIDAVGLCAFIGTLRAIRESGTPAALIVARPALRAVLEASGVDTLVPIVRSLADALAQIRPAPVTLYRLWARCRADLLHLGPSTLGGTASRAHHRPVGTMRARVLVCSIADVDRHDTGHGHPERPARLRAVDSGIRQAELGDAVGHLEGRPAGMTKLSRVHGKLYLDALAQFAAVGGGDLDPDTPVSRGS